MQFDSGAIIIIYGAHRGEPKEPGLLSSHKVIMAIPILILLVACASSQEFDHDWNNLDAGLSREEIGRGS